jgi:hypothetical protein
MSLIDLLPTLRTLPRADKIQAIQFLAAELAREEEQLGMFQSGATYSVWSPHDAYEAAAALRKLLETEKSAP